jgi:hypothetical protein
MQKLQFISMDLKQNRYSNKLRWLKYLPNPSQKNLDV